MSVKKIIIRLLIVIVVVVISLVVYLSLLVKQMGEITQGIPIEQYNNSRAALLVIDLQESTTGSTSTEDSYTINSDSFISSTNLAIKKAYKQNIPVIYIRSEISNWLINLIDNSVAIGSRGAQLDSRLLLVSDNIITKDKEDSFCNTMLDSLLISEQINQLFIIGLDAAHCVNSTITAAQNRQYKITVISDLILSETEQLRVKMLNDFRDRKIEVILLDKFLENPLSH